jgi:transposase
MKYSGIDLHSNNSVVTVIDETDKVVAEKRLPNDLTKILAFLEPHRDELGGVVVESTFNWYWLVDGLQEAGHTVHLANTTAIKKYEGLKHSGDETDARHLAHLLRLGILPTGTILPPEHRAVRDLARKRMQLVQTRSTQVLSIETILSRTTGRRLSSNQIKRLKVTDLPALGLSEDVALAIQAHVAVIEVLQQQIAEVEKRLQERVAPEDDFKRLMTVPGIGTVLATMIYLETGPIDRFADAGNYASYARCVNSR